jgi:hypothetical protein
MGYRGDVRMTIQLSTGLRSRLLGPEAFEDILAPCEIRIFTGPQPAGADMGQTGMRLGTVALRGAVGTPLELVRSGVVVAKPTPAVWLMTAMASGTAGWFRLCRLSDAGVASSVAPRIDGSITRFGTIPSGESVWDDTVITAGQTYPMDLFLFTLPPLGA